MDSVVIYNPSEALGGTNLLLSNFAVILVETGKFKVSVVDYEEGECFAYLDSLETSYEKIIKPEGALNVSEGYFVCIFLHIKLLAEEEIYLEEEVSPVFWSTHPLDGIKILPYSNLLLYITNEYLRKSLAFLIDPWYYKRVQHLLSRLTVGSNLVFMDTINADVNKRFYNIKTDVKIEPLVVINNSNGLGIDKPLRTSVAILGRLVDFKFRGIKIFLEQLADAGLLDVNISFIGEGPFEKDIKECLISLGFQNYNFIGHVPFEELEMYLLRHNITLAMGTSIINAAAQSLAVLVQPVFYEKASKKEVRFQWFSDLNVEDTGSLVLGPETSYTKYIDDLRAVFMDNELREDISYRCYEKFIETYGKEAQMIRSTNLLRNCSKWDLENMESLRPRFLSAALIKVKTRLKAKFEVHGDKLSIRKSK